PIAHLPRFTLTLQRPPISPLFPYTTLFRSKDGEIPILVYNPHPYPVTTTVECEFMLADQNHEPVFTLPTVYAGEQKVKSQPEKEDRKSTRLNSSHVKISYAVFCLKKKKTKK